MFFIVSYLRVYVNTSNDKITLFSRDVVPAVFILPVATEVRQKLPFLPAEAPCPPNLTLYSAKRKRSHYFFADVGASLKPRQHKDGSRENGTPAGQHCIRRKARRVSGRKD
ncbi:MAG: hypothetical protein CV087_22435 [Candidatus Brocadia sp. WS118]|nr:MAG: hypothetical protein CV087_22435 [Candidatus Brocadia sp. WS118]